MKNLIHSPHYPSNYNLNDTCNWKLIGPRGRQLQLHFHDFQTEKNADKLTIYDGQTSGSSEIVELHGESIPSDVISTGNSLFLEFHSNDVLTYLGFEIEVTLKMPDEFVKILGKTCKTTHGTYTTLDTAISHCTSNKACIVYDAGCDNEDDGDDGWW